MKEKKNNSCCIGNLELIKLLIFYDADPEITDKEGKPPESLIPHHEINETLIEQIKDELEKQKGKIKGRKQNIQENADSVSPELPKQKSTYITVKSDVNNNQSDTKAIAIQRNLLIPRKTKETFEIDTTIIESVDDFDEEAPLVNPSAPST